MNRFASRKLTSAVTGLYTALDCSRRLRARSSRSNENLRRVTCAARVDPRRDGPREPSMSLRIYNTLSRALEDFSPIEPGHVRMYVCGITVYELCHVGHARANMVFD